MSRAVTADERDHDRNRRRVQPAGLDELGLRRAMADRMLPFVVAAMAFLAALGLAGWVGAAALARHWQSGPATALTVQVPDPAHGTPPRIERALAALQAAPGVAGARIVSKAELARLLRPWLGDTSGMPALPLPGVIAVRLVDPGQATGKLAAALAKAVPQASVQSDGVWVVRLARLARSLQACAGVALLALAAVAIAVIAVATRAGIAARRDAIEIVHGLG
ncbi:MAG: cell division protein FtsX, partial [Acetobacteraceae bacterium]